jgi:hypothetical protein
VLDMLSETSIAGRADQPGAAERHWRVIARSILDGYPVGQLQRRFPTVDGLVDSARRSYPDDTEARLAAGHAVALTLGWQLFEPFIRSAAGLEHVAPSTVRAAVRAVSGRLLQPRAVAREV